MSRTSLLVLATLLLAAPSLWAGDARPVDLPLVSGATIHGTVESADAKEVVVRVGAEELRRIPWPQLQPLGVFRAKAALAPASEGEARLQLAELAADLGLYAETREEYEKALALGAIDRKRFDEVVADAEKRAVTQGVERARMLAEAGDPEAGLDIARRLKLDFTNAPNATMVDKLIGDLLARLKALDLDAAKDAAELQRVQAELERNKEILKRLTLASQLVDEADVDAKEAADARAVGNVTKARKHAEVSDGKYMSARKNLGRLRRILPREHETRKEVLARLTELDRKQFALLFATAKFHWDQRVYTRAEEWANRAAYIDPVNPDLMEIRDLLRENRIRYKVSDVTNARPIIR
jgi:hypothetical protein